MSDTAQIVGVAGIVFFMLMALYRLEHKKDIAKPVWYMFIALILGVMLF